MNTDIIAIDAEEVIEDVLPEELRAADTDDKLGEVADRLADLAIDYLPYGQRDTAVIDRVDIVDALREMRADLILPAVDAYRKAERW